MLLQSKIKTTNTHKLFLCFYPLSQSLRSPSHSLFLFSLSLFVCRSLSLSLSYSLTHSFALLFTLSLFSPPIRREMTLTIDKISLRSEWKANSKKKIKRLAKNGKTHSPSVYFFLRYSSHYSNLYRWFLFYFVYLQFTLDFPHLSLFLSHSVALSLSLIS